MLMLDARTLETTLCIVSFLSSIVLALLHLHYPKIPGVRDWAISSALPGFGMILSMGPAETPLLLSYYAAESAILFAAVFMLRGVQRFAGHAPDRLVPGAVVVATFAALIYFRSYAGTLLADIPVTVAWEVLSIWIVWALFKGAPKGLSARRILGVVYVANVLIQSVVTANALGGVPYSGNLDSEGWVSLLFPLSSAIFVSETVLLLAMVAERLGEDVKQQAHDLEVALERERVITQEQRNFLGMLSHEFRTPLSAIGASADLIRLGVGESARETDEELERIKRSVDRLGALVDRCLADDWLDVSAQSQRMEAIDLSSMLSKLSTERDVALSLADPQPIHVDGDPDLLPVAVSNLIDNACKFGRTRTGVRVRCAVGVGADVCIEVEDDGPGIRPDEVPRIFEKYYRSPSKQQKPGTGFGLFIVKRIIEMHGGRVEVAVPDNGGALFRVVLPLSAEVSA